MEAEDVMLTTYDNPFDPFEDFEQWWKQDLLLGHNCCGRIAEVAMTRKVASDEDNDLEVLRAIDEIVNFEPMIYKKVYKKDFAQAT